MGNFSAPTTLCPESSGCIVAFTVLPRLLQFISSGRGEQRGSVRNGCQIFTEAFMRIDTGDGVEVQRGRRREKRVQTAVSAGALCPRSFGSVD